YVYDDGIYGQNYIGLEEPEPPEMVMEYASTGISVENKIITAMPTNTCFLALLGNILGTKAYSTNIIDQPAIIYYDQVKASQERKTVTLAHTQPLYGDIRNAISYYNLQNSEYRIVTKDYSGYNTTEFPDGAVDQLSKELGTGEFPDIIYITGEFDYTNLTQKGFMANLYDLGFDGSKLLNVVRTNCEYGGGLYKLPMHFRYTAALNWDGIESLTIADMLEMYKIHGNALFRQLDRDALIDYLFGVGALGNYIDYANAECNFNTQEFIDLLEFFRSYNNRPDSDHHIRVSLTSLANQQLVKGHEGVFFLTENHFEHAALREFNYLYDGLNYSISGFPTSVGSGIHIETQYDFGITAASANKEAALQFLMLLFESEESFTYFWKDHQRTSAELFERRLEAYYAPSDLRVDYYSIVQNAVVRAGIDNIIRREFLDSLINDPNNTIIEVSQEEIDNIVNLMNTAVCAPADDAKVLEILWDELTPFLAGQDTAENVAHRINSRVGIYLAERYS
nr:hypothetical protein [Clostridia bacterium]